MSILYKKILLAVVLLFVICIATVFAWLKGKEAGIKVAIQDSFYVHKLHAGRELDALKNLRSGKYEDVRSNLETGLNLSIMMLSRDDQIRIMNNNTRLDMLKFLHQIKEYRQVSPWLEGDESLRLKIEETLSKLPKIDQ
jgi:hypothetical protein